MDQRSHAAFRHRSEEVDILSATDFDDILEELDPEFQASRRAAAKEYRMGNAMSLRDHLENCLSACRAG